MLRNLRLPPCFLQPWYHYHPDTFHSIVLFLLMITEEPVIAWFELYKILLPRGILLRRHRRIQLFVIFGRVVHPFVLVVMTTKKQTSCGNYWYQSRYPLGDHSNILALRYHNSPQSQRRYHFRRRLRRFFHLLRYFVTLSPMLHPVQSDYASSFSQEEPSDHRRCHHRRRHYYCYFLLYCCYLC